MVGLVDIDGERGIVLRDRFLCVLLDVPPDEVENRKFKPRFRITSDKAVLCQVPL